MNKIKLAIVYQVIFHYRVPFYKEIEDDDDIDYTLFHGAGVEGTKLKNAKNYLKNKQELFTLKMPFSFKGKKKYFSFFPFLFFSLIKNNPDVILLEGSSSIFNNMSVYFYSLLFRKKIIFWSLGQVKGKKKSKVRKFVDPLIMFFEKRASAIFTYSSQGKDYFLERGVSEGKIFKGVNVIDTREVLRTINTIQKKNNEFRILFVGSIIPEKKIELLLDCFLQLEKKIDDIYLDIIGSGNEYYSNLVNLYEKESNNIVFHGRKTEGLDSYYFNSDVFVLPGLGGLAIAESMAYGVPVICSTADGTEEDLIDQFSGIIIKNISKEKLYKKIVYLHSNRDLLGQMGDKAKERIQNNFNFDNYYLQFKKSLIYSYEN